MNAPAEIYDLKAQIIYMKLNGPNRRSGESLQTAINIVAFTFQSQRTEQLIYMIGRHAASQFVGLLAAFLRYRNRGRWIVQQSVGRLRLINPNNPSEIHTIQVFVYRRQKDADVVMNEMEDGLEALTLQN